MRNSLVSLLMAGTVALAGCGGGSGNPRPSDITQIQLIVSDAYSADPERTRATVARVASSLPQFGSVTQSSNQGDSGITADVASTTFDGRNVLLTVARQDGSPLRLDSAVHTVPDSTIDQETPIRNHTDARSRVLLDYTNSSFTVGLAAVSWNNSDSTDYLAGGYWMHAIGDFSAERVTGIEVGAFIDGPELDGSASVPPIGTATYTGTASGLYVYEYGSGLDETLAGTVEVGVYEGVATLNADFGAGTIAGCVGCAGAVIVTGVTRTPDGRSTDFDETETSVLVRMGPATIGSDGSFRNRDVGVEARGRTVANASGSWGGKFSSIQGNDGDPRLVAGTNGAEWSEPDGSQGVLTGVFFGAK